MRRNVLMGLNGLLLLGCLVAVVAALRRERRVVAGPPSDATFIGQKKCRVCHFKDFRSWKKMKHSGAWWVLSEKDRARPECQRCHVTGYGRPGGYVSEAETPHLTGVQCEACHGAGSAHAELAKVEESEEKIDALIDGRPQNRCVECHNTHKMHEEYETESTEERSGRTFDKLSAAVLSESKGGGLPATSAEV